MVVDGAQGVDKNGRAVQAMSLSTVQSVDGSSSSTQSTAFSNSSIVRITTLGDIYVSVGTNPTAVLVTSSLILGGSTEYFHIKAGDKIAVIGDVANITLME